MGEQERNIPEAVQEPDVDQEGQRMAIRDEQGAAARNPPEQGGVRVNPTRPAQKTPEVRAHETYEKDRKAENQDLRSENLNVLFKNPERTTLQFDTHDRDEWLRMMPEFLEHDGYNMTQSTRNCTILKNGRITVVSYDSGQFLIYGKDKNTNDFERWFEKNKNRITDLHDDMERMNLRDHD